MALRDENKKLIAPDALKGMSWNGNWAVVAQDDFDVFNTLTLACIPVGGTALNTPRAKRPNRVLAITRSGERAWSDWRWEHGRMRLQASPTIDELIGFLVLSS